jgi:hypothetical protein
VSRAPRKPPGRISKRGQPRSGGSPDLLIVARRVVDYLNAGKADPGVLLTVESHMNRQEGVQMWQRVPPGSTAAEIEKWLREIIDAFRLTSRLTPKAFPIIELNVLRYVLPLLLDVTVDGRRVLPRLRRCPNIGGQGRDPCPRFYLEEKGRRACSRRCAEAVRSRRRYRELVMTKKKRRRVTT